MGGREGGRGKAREGEREGGREGGREGEGRRGREAGRGIEREERRVWDLDIEDSRRALCGGRVRLRLSH